MRKHYSLIEADKILNLLMKDPFVKDIPHTSTIECYQNGREQGYSITDTFGSYSWAITFSRSRNSDSLVVYSGPSSNKGVSDGAYKNYNTYVYNAYKEVVEYIVGLLNIAYGDFNQLPKWVNEEDQFIQNIVKARLKNG